MTYLQFILFSTQKLQSYLLKYNHNRTHKKQTL